MNFELKMVTPEIYHLVFPSERLMCKTMVRFAEFFESPKWRGKIFGWRQFKSWYTWDKGEFSYYDDWGGFNIPGYAFRAFFEGSFHPLSWGEKDVLGLIPREHQNFYVIATSEDNEEAIRHELAHAFYYLDADYRAAVSEITSQLPATEVAKRAIRKTGYHEDVLDDELHAYLIDGIKHFDEVTSIRKELGVSDLLRYWLAGRRLNKLFDATMVKHSSKQV